VYIGRDGRDVLWSQYNHHAKANDGWYDALNNTPGLVGPPIDKPPETVLEYWRDWLDRDGHPWWPFWENVRSWWAVKDLPNVYFLHFASLKNDMPGEIRRLAEFLEIPINENKWDDILLHCSFDYMKANAAKTVPLGGAFWDGGSQTFIHKGTNDRWREVLGKDDVLKYEQRAKKELGEECARWLVAGTHL
jgi:aryl sulfotransferase